MTARVRVDGKGFRLGAEPFLVRGVSYGTFEPRDDGTRFPPRDQVKRDFDAMNRAGFNTVRTYTEPPDDVLDLAADWDLRVLAGVFYEDWRYLVGASTRQRRRVAREARLRVRDAARRLAGNDHVLAVVVGNELPADVVRWLGHKPAGDLLASLADTVAEEDPSRLTTYGNYPTTEFLQVDNLDFLLFNVFLEDRAAFRRYLTKLHHLAGDRPLVLGEIGFHAGTSAAGEQAQAQVLDWQLAVAAERGVAGTTVFSWTDEWWVGDGPVEGWHFGLTRTDRSPRPALDVARRWNDRSVRDVDFPWPSMSVVVCAYNAAATLDECLGHACALDYPGLEVIVVDDGSSDDTAAIARRHSRARLVEIEHAGLSAARNAGLLAATGEIVAYLDADAYPTPDWPYYLAAAFDGPNVAGAGGPNLPPSSDPPGAHRVARAPGGPVHVLLTNDRAEHVPGCNMAFWREALHELGGFDPVFEAAGDDIDLCWRLLDHGWEIGFHPAAVVWHHRRPTARAYLRQQRGYGRAEALVEARHPERFTALGTARWSGVIYDSFAPRAGRQRIYRGSFGAAPFQAIYPSHGHAVDVANQVGVPLGAALSATAPLALVAGTLGVPALAGLAALAVLAVVNFVRAPRLVHPDLRPIPARLAVTALTMAQPLVRAWSRRRHRVPAMRGAAPAEPPPAPTGRAGRGVLVYPADRDRTELAAAVIGGLRRGGLRVVLATGWEDCDGRIPPSPFLWGDIVTTDHPAGCIQLRVRRRPRWRAVVAATALVALAAATSRPLLAAAAVVTAAALLRELWRTGPHLSRLLRAGGPR